MHHSHSFKHAQTMLAFIAIVGTANSLFAQCTPEWSDVFATPGVIGNGVNAVCVWDDGSGPAVYIAGEFANIGDIATSGFPQPNTTGAHSIVKLTPDGYQTLGNGIGPIAPIQVTGIGNPRVIRAMMPYDPDGAGPEPSKLYVAGAFTFASAAGTSVGSQRWSIASWDGSAWSRVGDEFLPGLAFGDLSVGNAIRFNARAMAVYDADGSGPLNPELYVGGAFPTAGGVAAQGIARWNGTNWDSVGGPFASAGNVVYSLAVVDEDGDGPGLPVLYAAGDLTAMGDGTGVTGLARWDGLAWSAVPGIEPAEPGNPDLNHITAVAAQTTSSGQVLWVGGNLIVNGQPCGVARLVSGMWECVYTDGDSRGGTIANDSVGLPMTVQRIAQFGDDMYFFGPPTPGVTPSPCLLGSFPGGLYRWSASTGAVTPVADIDSLHHALGGLGFGDQLNVGVMTPIDLDLDGPEPDKLFIGGNFNVIGGAARTDMCAYNGNTFEAIHPHASAANGLVGSSGQDDAKVLTTFDVDGAGPGGEWLVVAGRFHAAGDAVSPNVVAFDGAACHAMPIGANATFCDGVDFNGAPAFLDFARFDDGSGARLFAGTNNGVLVWDGSAWSQFAQVPQGGFVFRLESFDDGSGAALWALGRFSNIAGVAANGAAKWNGTTWVDASAGLGVGTPPAGIHFDTSGVYDFGTGPRIFATGTDFTNDEAIGERYFEVFDGGQWVPLTNNPAYGNIDGEVSDSVVFDGQLFFSGTITQINGSPVSARIVGWNGSSWFDTGAPTGLSGFRLATHDDGTGLALYVATSGSSGSIWKWDGASSWSQVPSSVIPNMNDLATFDDGTGPALYVAHASIATAGMQSIGLSRYKTPCTACPPCAADYDNNGGVDGGDLGAFFADFEAGATCADVDGNGGVDGGDLGFFFAAFEAGGC